jgi:hypothetical protein
MGSNREKFNIAIAILENYHFERVPKIILCNIGLSQLLLTQQA